MSTVIVTAWDEWADLPLVPAYQHDCKRCVLVAQVWSQAKVVDDIYLCPLGRRYSTLARHSSDGPDYTTWSLRSATVPILRMAPDWALAVAAGILSGHLTKKGTVR